MISRLDKGRQLAYIQGWELSSDLVRGEISWKSARLKFKCRAQAGRLITYGSLVSLQDCLKDPGLCSNEQYCAQ